MDYFVRKNDSPLYLCGKQSSKQSPKCQMSASSYHRKHQAPKCCCFRCLQDDNKHVNNRENYLFLSRKRRSCSFVFRLLHISTKSTSNQVSLWYFSELNLFPCEIFQSFKSFYFISYESSDKSRVLSVFSRPKKKALFSSIPSLHEQ